MIIGLTGKNASGKGVVGSYLQERGFLFHSLSDVLRDGLKKRKKPITRDNLTWLGNQLRDQFGPSVLADKILEWIEDDRHYVIDSFRNPEEVKAFRRTKDFILISVEASPKVRYERMKTRRRGGDARSFQDFLQVEKREKTSKDPTKQNLDACAQLADTKLSNNGSLNKFFSSINSLMRKLLMKRKRPTWDEYFMKIAKMVSTRSNCMKRSVAAVIVKDGRIISTGYNGTPRGVKNCNEGGCPRCNSFSPSGRKLGECYCSHAEENAIVQASYHGIDINQAKIYTTFSPCLICTKMIINSGIHEVIFNEAYPLATEPLNILKEAGVKPRKVSTHGAPA